MPAPAGNLNAEKWTVDHTEHLLEKIEDLIGEDGIHYLGQALAICNAYGELWSRLRKKWKDNEDITHRMKVIEQRFEANVVCGSLTGRYKASAARLVLKHYNGFEPEVPRESKKQKEEEEFQQMVADVEAVVGPLCDHMKMNEERRNYIKMCHGATLEQLTDAGFAIQDGCIYPPDHPRMLIDGEYHII